MNHDALQRSMGAVEDGNNGQERSITPETALQRLGQRAERTPQVRAGSMEVVSLSTAENPSEGVTSAAETTAPKELKGQPGWRRLLDGLFSWSNWDTARNGASRVERVARETARPTEVAVAMPHFAPDDWARAREDASSVPQDDLNQMHESAERSTQAESVDRGHDHRRVSLSALHSMTDDLLEIKVELLVAELNALRDESRLVLEDTDKPPRQRLQETSDLRERLIRIEQQIAETQALTSQHIAAVGSRAVVIEESAGTGLSDDTNQREHLAVGHTRLEERRATRPADRSRLWPVLLALALVTAVGVAGILLPRPREADAVTRLWIGLASAYQGSGDTAEAIEALDEAILSGIRDPEMLGQVGVMYSELQAYEKAIPVLEQAVAQDPQNESYRLSLAQSYGSAGYHLEAIDQCGALIDINPGEIWYYVEMGLNYRGLGNYDQALVYYQKALDARPSLWQAYHHQGDVYRMMERYDEAIGLYQKALEINPDYYWTRLFCGQSYMGKNDPTTAIEQYQTAIRIDPGQAEAYFYLGEAYLAQERFAQAVEPYQQAITRNDRYTAAYVGLGKAYVALNDCTNAIVRFREALRLDANNAEAQEGLDTCE